MTTTDLHANVILNEADNCIYPQPAPANIYECYVSIDPVLDAEVSERLAGLNETKKAHEAKLEATPKERRTDRRNLKEMIAAVEAEITTVAAGRPARIVDERKAVDFILSQYAPAEGHYRTALAEYIVRVQKYGAIDALKYSEEAIKAEVYYRQNMAQMDAIHGWCAHEGGYTLATVIKALNKVKDAAIEKIIRSAGGSTWSGHMYREAENMEIKALADLYTNDWRWNEPMHYAQRLYEDFQKSAKPAPVAAPDAAVAQPGGVVLFD